MKRRVLTVLAAIGLSLLWCTAFGAFQEGVRLKADGKVIDIDVGLLVPCVTDWNGDGKKDLLVGQFRPGKIRLYLNRGSDAEPLFKDFEYMEAGGEEISVPYG